MPFPHQLEETVLAVGIRPAGKNMILILSHVRAPGHYFEVFPRGTLPFVMAL